MKLEISTKLKKLENMNGYRFETESVVNGLNHIALKFGLSYYEVKKYHRDKKIVLMFIGG